MEVLFGRINLLEFFILVPAAFSGHNSNHWRGHCSSEVSGPRIEAVSFFKFIATIQSDLYFLWLTRFMAPFNVSIRTGHSVTLFGDVLAGIKCQLIERCDFNGQQHGN